MRRLVLLALLVLTWPGACAGWTLPSEAAARRELRDVTAVYRPGNAHPSLPVLSAEAPLDDFLRYAMLRQPRVEAAYYAWAAQVERIAPARSLPDPRLTFSADIGRMVEALMPGLMLDLPAPGKLRAAGDAAAHEAAAGYAGFTAEVLRTALAVKGAWYRLHFVEDTLRAERESLALLGDLEELARSRNAAGQVTLQDVLRAQIERERLATRIANLEDSRGVLLAEFKSALGLKREEPDPPVPAAFAAQAAPPAADDLWAAALRRNPGIRAMEAEVRTAQAMLEMARAGRRPDLSAGVEMDVKANPLMWTPQAGLTLPVWRDKIRGEIAAAQARKRQAEARLSAEQVALAAELAAMLYEVRQGGRDAALLADRLLPRGKQSLEAARTGYAAGKSSFLDVVEAQRQLLMFEVDLVEARTRRELALASLSLALAGVPPQGAPLPGDEGPPPTRSNP